MCDFRFRHVLDRSQLSWFSGSLEQLCKNMRNQFFSVFKTDFVTMCIFLWWRGWDLCDEDKKNFVARCFSVHFFQVSFVHLFWQTIGRSEMLEMFRYVCIRALYIWAVYFFLRGSLCGNQLQGCAPASLVPSINEPCNEHRVLAYVVIGCDTWGQQLNCQEVNGRSLEVIGCDTCGQ